MRSASILSIGSALLLATPLLLASPPLVSEAFAHGGAYRGPPGEVPPDSRPPSDPPPPPAGGGPTTPGGETDGPTTPGDDVGGGPTTPDGGTPGTGTPGAGPTPSEGPGGGAKTGVRAPGTAKGPGYAGWVFWWNFNKDEVLDLEHALAVSPPTGSGLNKFGKNAGGRAGVVAATRAAVDAEVVPALRAMLDDEKLNFDIRSAAAIALAKIGDRRIVPTLRRMARNEGSYHRVVEESAALALGLLQHGGDDVRDFLLGTIADQERSASYVRPFAAISLGLLGTDGDPDGRVREALIDAVARPDPRIDMKPACLTALGLLGDDRAVPALLTMLEARSAPRRGAEKLSDNELAFVVQALGRIGRLGVDEDGQAVLRTLTGLVTAGRGKNRAAADVARSAAIALGQVGVHADDGTRLEILKTLKGVARFAKDDSERTFALIAIGRLAAADGVDPDARREAVATLRHYLREGRPANLVQPYAALAMGLVGRGSRTAVTEDELRQPLRDAFDEARRGDPRTRGSYAIASGLTRDPLAVASLVEVLSDRGNDKRLRGHAAIALGMIGDPAARAAIRSALTAEVDRELRVQTAIAAGLMGDAGAVTPLVKILTDGEESQYVLGSVALALGKIGDQRAIGPLLAIARDPGDRYPDITRALATVALGQIGDFRDAPVLSRVSTDFNFRAMGGLPAIVELLTIL